MWSIICWSVTDVATIIPVVSQIVPLNLLERENHKSRYGVPSNQCKGIWSQVPSVGARWDCAHSPLVLDFFCSLVYFVTPTRPPSKGILHKQFWTLQESQVQLGFFYYFVFKLFFLMEKLSLRVVAYSDCRWVISLRDPHQKGSLLTQGLFCLHSCWDKSWASLVLAQQKHPVEHFFWLLRLWMKLMRSLKTGADTRRELTKVLDPQFRLYYMTQLGVFRLCFPETLVGI